ECHRVVSARTPACQECGYLWPRLSQALPEAQGLLVDVSSREDHIRAWARLCQEAEDNGYEAGWAYHRFRAMVHCKPSRHAAPPRQRQRLGQPSLRQRILEAIETNRGRLDWVDFGFTSREGCK